MQDLTETRGVAGAERTLTTDAIPTANEVCLWQETWNQTRTEDPCGDSIVELFARQAALTPMAIAVADQDDSLTYQALNGHANQLAHHLQTLGVGPDVPVGVCLERSNALLVALLGILKAGGAYVPLDPAYPVEHLGHILADTRVPVIITRQELLPRLPSQAEHRLCIDTQAETLARYPATEPDSRATPEHLSHIVYTSGSTGRPKGVAVPQRQLLNRLAWLRRALPFAPGEVACQRSAIGFSVSLAEFLGPLLQGIRTIILPDAVVKDAQKLVEALAEHGVTRIVIVPSLLRILLETDIDLAARLGKLKWWSVCGEKVSLALFQRFRERLPDAVMLHQYGASEVNDITWFDTRHQEPDYTYVPLGRPLDNTRIYLLDPNYRPVPVGEAGEVYVDSPGLARGYLNQPDMTAERFVPNPFCEEPGGRLYCMGDLARRLPNGQVEYLGRRDHQVKIRGIRVELGGLEQLLSQQPNVRRAVVMAREDIPGEKYLAAYIVPHRQPAPTVSELRRSLRQHLPEAVLPGAFVFLEEFPLTPSGKIHRMALPAPAGIRPHLERAYVPPRTSVEEALTETWSQVLGMAQIGIHDDFFELGGHSLLAMRLLGLVRETFSVDLSLPQFIAAPTIAQLAALLEQGHMNAAVAQFWQPLVPAPEQRHVPFPLTEVQQAYWVGRNQAFELGNVAALSYQEFDCERLDMDGFQAAWQKLVERHAMLRAVVHPDGQQQILVHVPPYTIQILDLSEEQSAESVTAQLAAVRQEMLRRNVPGDRWPLFEVRATRLPGQRVRLHLSLDLLIADAWSALCITRDLEQLMRDPANDLPPLALTFRDCVLAEETLRDTEHYRQSWQYWLERLPNLPPAPELPLARQPNTIERPIFTQRQRVVPADVWAQLKKRAAQAGLTATGLVLAAFAETLAVWSKQPQFTLNLTLFNRLPRHPEITAVVGDFTSITLLAVDNAGAASFGARAHRLQEQLWQDLEHRYVSGVRVLRELGHRQREGAHALMPIVFTSTLNLGVPTETAAQAALGEPAYSFVQTPQVWLDQRVSESNGALVLTWDAVEELFPPGLLDDLLGTCANFLEYLAEKDTDWQQALKPALPPAQLAERAAANATVAPVSAALLHGLFEQQALRHPQQPAVIAAQRTLSYATLAQMTRQIARWLRANGARPNRLVAIVMEKGWEQAAAALGILQAGAAYLPIDPTLPRERVWHLLADAEIQIVLTQSWLDEALEWPQGLLRASVDRGDAWAGLEAEALEPRQQPGDLAYVIYTSGSTGKPKGVMIDHRGAVNTILDVNRRFAVGPQDRVLALSALNFDLSVYDIFGLLAAGGTIVVPDAGAQRDPRHWAELIARHGVTLWNTVPALMEMLAEYLAGHSESGADSLRGAANLRLVMMSGDWIPVTLPHRIRRFAPQARLISLGGATEASIWSILYPIEQVDPAWKSIPYGKPMINQQFHVLDRAMQPCPTWVPGDLYIGGIGLALGYWRDTQKTDERFITHPGTGERLYKTGDLGRYLPDGNIEFLGREDFQVKLHGYRIELGEIESALMQHSDVQVAVVALANDQAGSKHLAAYVVRQPATTPDADALRQFLRGKLPAYMVPASVVVLDTLPLTANGKIDRKALLALEAQPAPSITAFVAPDSALERQLSSLWAEILALETVGSQDDFFERGGDSFKAIRLVGKIGTNVAKGASVTILDLYQHPTPQALAQHISAQSGRADVFLSALKRAENEAVVLVCIPYGGGQAIAYQPLANALPDTWSLYAANLPGHDVNHPGESLQPVEAVAQHSLEALQDLLAGRTDLSVILYGHSAGVALTLELARLLEAAGQTLRAVGLGGALLPELLAVDRPRLQAPTLQSLQAYFGKQVTAPPDFLDELEKIDDPAKRERLLKNLHHDRDSAAAYLLRFLESPSPWRLRAPLLCVAGSRDPLTPHAQERFRAWAAFSETVGLTVIDGGDHLFIKSHAAALAQALAHGAQL
ncbi:MAG: amino acid adenylation domain-containing protein [Chloroflexota bacterium]